MKGLTKLLATLCFASICNSALGVDAGSYEFSGYIPFTLQKEFNFEGGASAKVESAPGFGFSFGFNQTDKFTTRVDVAWNSYPYSAERVIDDGAGTIKGISGRMDSLTIGLGGDFYLTNGTVAPYIAGNFGWSYLDTNIPTGDYGSSCWWDPWWGYICSSTRYTYSVNSWYYGVGAGLRISLNPKNFVRVGYYETFLNYSNAKGNPHMGSVRLEFGISY